MMDIYKSWLVESYIAHRGLHTDTLPENSLGAFENAIKKGYPIETDVHLLSDGTVVIFHDDSLKRMTDSDGYIKNLTAEELKKYKLAGTEYSIPTLDEFLELVAGRVPVLFEIKNSGKVGELEKALYEKLKGYKGEYAVQSFNPFSLEWFKNNAPEVLRGQLSGCFKNSDLGFFKRLFLKRMALNKKVSEPHFIAYEAKCLPNRYVRKYKHLPLLAWTVRSQEEYMHVIKFCDNIIFENFEPEI